jgi:hypothetical protein
VTKATGKSSHGDVGVCVNDLLLLLLLQVMSLDSTGSRVVGSNVKMVGRTITGVKTMRLSARSGSTGGRGYDFDLI